MLLDWLLAWWERGFQQCWGKEGHGGWDSRHPACMKVRVCVWGGGSKVSVRGRGGDWGVFVR